MNAAMRIFAAVILFCLATPLAAQEPDYAQRSEDLTSLSRAFGELHHIRRLCDPRAESEVWRERMRKLLDLETPAPALRDRMIEAFNDGFRSAESRFPYCDRDARNHAALVATQADKVATRLVEPIYQAMTQTPVVEPPRPDDDADAQPY
ncbi:MAG: TIGR02301 family protein [Alphaproteobacteria bacterium]|nr:TIGR02301 family protein [Alphaproteobacteria bacterium]